MAVMAVFNGPAIKTEIIDEILKSVAKPQDLLGKDGVLKQLTARLVERVLQAEMADHLGYEHGERRLASSGNGRDGYTTKTLATDYRPVSVSSPVLPESLRHSRNCGRHLASSRQATKVA